MVRIGILASAVPLVLAGLFAHSELMPGPRPCIEAGGSSLQIAEAPWHADLHVTFTEVASTATVRVQIVESAETADFVMVDDADSTDVNACAGAPRFVAISAYPSASAPVIYLSTEGGADYRIFVRSKTFSLREAAALIVGANGGHARMAAASL
ncbi:MAG: hypothetical protein QOD09_2204 [Bradyrhizobium sp.]|jgi:hypothetical protein|nr:hypothetical protein [Bradyrhizobium sp.]